MKSFIDRACTFRLCLGGDEEDRRPDEGGSDGDPRSWRRELVIDADGATHIRTLRGSPERTPPDGDATVETLFETLPENAYF